MGGVVRFIMEETVLKAMFLLDFVFHGVIFNLQSTSTMGTAAPRYRHLAVPE